MNYSLSRIQQINEIRDPLISECQHPLVWYEFILSTALFYYTTAIMSMIFTKESRRLREISLLYDTLILFIMLPSLVEWFGFSPTDSSIALVINISSHQKIQLNTCFSIAFLHSSLQASFVVALIYTIYAENILISNMATINPKPVVTISLLVLQVTTGFTVATVTALIDTSNKECFANGCCLHAVCTWSFKTIIDCTFDLCCIYAAYVLLRVSVDRFLKLLVISCSRSLFVHKYRNG